jgi:hypothetical protein
MGFIQEGYQCVLRGIEGQALSDKKWKNGKMKEYRHREENKQFVSV